MTKLYELTGEFGRLMDAVVDQETGEYDEDRVPGFAEILKELTGNIETKLEGCAKASKMMDVDIEALKAEEARLSKRRKSIDANKGRLRTYMRECMQAAGLDRSKTPMFTISLGKAGKMKVDVFDAVALPDDMRKYPDSAPPNKKLILAELTAGGEVAGARLVESDRVLTIR